MVQQFIKFIKKSPHRKLFEAVLKDILYNNLGAYDVKKMQGTEDLFRLRVWSVRFIFRKTPSGNIIMRVNNRWDIYKSL